MTRKNYHDGDGFHQGRIPKKSRSNDYSSSNPVHYQQQQQRSGFSSEQSNHGHDHYNNHNRPNDNSYNNNDYHRRHSSNSNGYYRQSSNRSNHYQSQSNNSSYYGRDDVRSGSQPLWNDRSSINGGRATTSNDGPVPFVHPFGPDGWVVSSTRPSDSHNTNNNIKNEPYVAPRQEEDDRRHNHRQTDVSSSVVMQPKVDTQEQQHHVQQNEAIDSKDSKLVAPIKLEDEIKDSTSTTTPMELVKEKTYSERVYAQLPPAHRNTLPWEEFPPGWEEKKIAAVQAVIKNKFDALIKEYTDDDDDDSDMDDQERAWKQGDRAFYRRFVETLPNCLPLTMGFHIVCSVDLEWCFCPCHRNMKPWCKSQGIWDEDIKCANGNGKYAAFGFVRHLKQMNDIYHKLILAYLEELYYNYYNVKDGGDNKKLLHKIFYDHGTPDYKLAEAHENRLKRQALEHIQILLDKEKERLEQEKERREELERKNNQLKAELEKLKTESPEKAEQMERLQEFMKKFQVEESVEMVSPETLESVGSSYCEFWTLCHNNIGMANKPAIAKIVFKVQQDIKLQQLFDDWFENSDASPLFCTNEKDAQRRKTAKQLLMLSTVQLMDEKELGKIKKEVKTETTGIDAGGLSRQFFSQVWRQMGGLAVEWKGTVIKLFNDESDAGCIPAADDAIEFKLLQIKGNERDLARAKISSYYRALGRLMIHWLATDPKVSFQPFDNPNGEQSGHALAAKVMPAFYRNVLLRGTNPIHSGYPLGDLGTHVLQIIDKGSGHKSKKEKQELLHRMFDLSGNAEEDALSLRKTAQEWWVDDRSIALSALREGLTLDGFANLVPALRFAPFGAVNQIIFAKSEVELKDVLDAIERAGPPAVEGEVQDLFELQFGLIEGLKSILAERSSREYKLKNPKADFLGRFVNFCTGQWTIPSSDYHKDFKIKIEFSDKHDDSLPIAHTCDNSIVFPGSAYYGNRETLEEKLDKTIALTDGRFSMQ